MATVLLEYHPADGRPPSSPWGYCRVTSATSRWVGPVGSEERELYLRIVFDTYYGGDLLSRSRKASWMPARLLFEPVEDNDGCILGQWKVRQR